MSCTVSCTVRAATGAPREQSVPGRGAGLWCTSPHSPVLSVAHPVFARIMSLPLPTNPVELSALRRRARRLVDTVSDLIRHGQHSYAAFRARAEATIVRPGQGVGPLC